MDNYEVVSIFANSTVEIFNTFASVAIKHISTSCKENYQCEKDYASILEFSGIAEGTAALCLPSALARSISCNLTGLTDAKITDSIIGDTIGELINQIVGASKAKLEGTPFYFSLHTPRPQKGSSDVFTNQKSCPCIRFTFAAEKGLELVLLLTLLCRDGIPLVP